MTSSNKSKCVNVCVRVGFRGRGMCAFRIMTLTLSSHRKLASLKTFYHIALPQEEEQSSNLRRLWMCCGILPFLLKATRLGPALTYTNQAEQNHKRARHRNQNLLEVRLLKFLFYVISPSYHPPRSARWCFRGLLGSSHAFWSESVTALLVPHKVT